MFYNSRDYERNSKSLENLRKRLEIGRQKTFQRVTKDFNSLEDFSKAQYISSKFNEIGFTSEGNDRQIRRVVGDEIALQVLGTYGGKNYRQAYINKFARQYGNSIQKRHEYSLNNSEREKARSNDEQFNQELIMKRKEDVMNFFKDSSPWTSEFKKKITNGSKRIDFKTGGGRADYEDDDDDDDYKKNYEREEKQFSLRRRQKPTSKHPHRSNNNDRYNRRKVTFQ